MAKIMILQTDIVTLDVDVIVNAANRSLLGGGGVDGAIHRAAGPALLEECRALGGCEFGEAKVTSGHNLKARWVIHTVGPLWKDGDSGEDAVLRSCYRNALVAASDLHATSIAFPAIGTGAYSFPHDRAAKIAVETVSEFVVDGTSLREIYLVGLDARTVRHLKNAAKKVGVDVY